MKKIIFLLCAIFSLSCTHFETAEPLTVSTEKSVTYSGLRSSAYGIDPFPSEKGWAHAFNKMEDYFPGSQACGIWIIGDINTETGACMLEFPRPVNMTFNDEDITFYNYDKHESYLDYFDANGIKVFLQVESGHADMKTLIDLVMNQYKHHPSVVGFGVDLEWWAPEKTMKGMNGDTYYSALSTETAMEWDAHLKSINPEYRLFLKHWVYSQSIMPPATTSDIIFISDAQDFDGLAAGTAKDAMERMVQEFSEWAAYFRRDGYVRSVGYQIGYDSDRMFWNELLADPHPQNFGNLILNEIPAEQEVSIFWVDFSMDEVFMRDFIE